MPPPTPDTSSGLAFRLERTVAAMGVRCLVRRPAGSVGCDGAESSVCSPALS